MQLFVSPSPFPHQEVGFICLPLESRLGLLTCWSNRIWQKWCVCTWRLRHFLQSFLRELTLGTTTCHLRNTKYPEIAILEDKIPCEREVKEHWIFRHVKKEASSICLTFHVLNYHHPMKFLLKPPHYVSFHCTALINSTCHTNLSTFMELPSSLEWKFFPEWINEWLIDTRCNY
jgi:hypothetical protein